MSFGRNPHVAKAQTAEQKAEQAGDTSARALAWREAARHWDRASEREMDAKRRNEYSAKADAARVRADDPDGEPAGDDDTGAPGAGAVASLPVASGGSGKGGPGLLN